MSTEQTTGLQEIRFLAPHCDDCGGCWGLMVDVPTQRAIWQCNECGETREVEPPAEITLNGMST